MIVKEIMNVKIMEPVIKIHRFVQKHFYVCVKNVFMEVNVN